MLVEAEVGEAGEVPAVGTKGGRGKHNAGGRSSGGRDGSGIGRG